MSNNLNQGASEAEHFATIEEAAQVLESAAAHNRAKGRTVLERTQQDRADRLRIALAALSTRRTPAATTGDGELPPLPDAVIDAVAKPFAGMGGVEDYRAFARAAIEADRAQQAGAVAPSIIVHANLKDDGTDQTASLQKAVDLAALLAAKDAETADLRAQLAAKGQDEPLACVYCAGKGQVHAHVPGGWAQCGECRGKGRNAAPASAQPADDLRAAVRKEIQSVYYRTTSRTMDEVIDAILAHLAPRQDTGAQPDQRESAAVRSREWQPVTGPGQVRKGDKLRFKIGDKAYSERAKLILHAGTDKEEVIYDKGRNFYFITAMVMSGFSNHKCVEVLAASPAAQPAKDEQMGREAIERRAKEIYATFVFADRYPWVEGGNSIRQDEARDAARKELSQDSANNGAEGEKNG